MTCSGGWVCEHRWRQVFNMVAFRNVVHGTSLQNWWTDGDFHIAFARGNKGLIIINADTDILNADITTGLPEGIYCDVISGNYEDGNCTGNIVQVDQMGQPHFTIDGQSDDPVVAIHIDNLDEHEEVLRCVCRDYLLVNILMKTIKLIEENVLRNKFDFWKVHGIMNTSGLLQSAKVGSIKKVTT